MDCGAARRLLASSKSMVCLCTLTLDILFQREQVPWVKYGPDIHIQVTEYW